MGTDPSDEPLILEELVILQNEHVELHENRFPPRTLDGPMNREQMQEWRRLRARGLREGVREKRGRQRQRPDTTLNEAETFFPCISTSSPSREMVSLPRTN
ncbi:hypothetical protein PG984_010128 [Apiospora sp. TS-2023a]